MKFIVYLSVALALAGCGKKEENTAASTSVPPSNPPSSITLVQQYFSRFIYKEETVRGTRRAYALVPTTENRAEDRQVEVDGRPVYYTIQLRLNADSTFVLLPFHSANENNTDPIAHPEVRGRYSFDSRGRMILDQVGICRDARVNRRTADGAQITFFANLPNLRVKDRSLLLTYQDVNARDRE